MSSIPGKSEKRSRMSARGLLRHLTGLSMAILFVALSGGYAAELEPRAYSNAPIGLNFLIAGYANSQGGLSTDPSSPIRDAHLRIRTGVVVYARSLDVWGKSGKFDLIMPYSSLSGNALVGGVLRERQVSGLVDPRFRFSVNFIGAPALSMQEFAAYQQDLIVGASIQVSAPLGQYDPGKLVNLGSNRWLFKPSLGISKAMGAFTLELSSEGTIFTKNDDYFGGGTFEQDPLYSVQAHVTYSFRRGLWGALDACYDHGGRTKVDGVQKYDVQKNSRFGATFAIPLNRNYSVKLYASTGVYVRTSSDYDLLGMLLQYRW